MKLKVLISHPYTLVASFFLVIASGDQVSGFHFLNRAVQPPYGILFSLLGLAGILLILVNHFRYRQSELGMEGCVVNLLGGVMLICSLFLYFYTDSSMYLNPSAQLRTMVPFLVFCTSLTCFITVLR
jgi:hypothetical protein